MAARMSARSDGGRSDGVPPPKKTEVTAGAPPARKAEISERQAATYAPISWDRSVQVAKAQ
jgi:hypothetical protein